MGDIFRGHRPKVGRGSPSVPCCVSISSPTRYRTRNSSLEPRHDVHFTIEPSAEGGGIEPYPTPFPGQLVSNQIPEPVRLPSVFIEWSHRELNPDFRNAIAVSSRWTMTPSVERRGIEPRSSACKTDIFPLDELPRSVSFFRLPNSAFEKVIGVGVEPTKSPRPQRDRFASLRTRPEVADPGVAPGGPSL